MSSQAPESDSNGSPNTEIKVKEPKRILHFSDGVMEEYSTDDEEEDQTDTTPTTLVNPAELTWGPWFWYKASSAGSTTLYAIDTMGEFLAAFFGITTPKYYFELEEQKRQEELKKKQEAEAKGWSDTSDTAVITVPLENVNSRPQDHDV